jgi:chemotaxis protein MotB
MSKGDRKGAANRQNVIIKREEIVEAPAHAGAWKVAYADFVTAMMAFFLLMWLLNATTEDQRKGLADYFSPNNLMSHASSGTGQPFGGHTAFDQGALVSDRGAVQVLVGMRPTTPDPSDSDVPPEPTAPAADDDQGQGAGQGQDQGAGQQTAPSPPPPGTAAATPAPATAAAAAAAAGPAQAKPEQPGEAILPRSSPGAAAAAAQPRNPTTAELRAAQEREEKATFARAAQQIRDAVRDDPALGGLAQQLAIDITPQGLRIQILDEDHRSMFPFGSDVPNDRAKLLLQKVTPVLAKLSQDISIAGYTDAAPFPGPDRTNWELSAERANATRRLLVEGGLPDSRVRSVVGHADRDPLLPADPLAAANRRIAILVLRSPLPPQQAAGAGNAGVASGTVPEPAGAGAEAGSAARGTAAAPVH